MTRNQTLFIVESLKALRDTKARIGSRHYTVTISLVELNNAVKELEQQLEEAEETVIRYNLLRDGKIILKNVNDLECLEYIHKHHPYSLSHALRYEGYKMEEL